MPLKKLFLSRFVLVAPALLLTLAVVVMPTVQAQSPAISPAAAPVANRITQAIDENNRVTLSGTVHPLARASNDRGAVPESMRLDRIQIVLKRSDSQESALKQLIGDLHRPGSASYHHWLTPEQFGQQFGPSDADLAVLEGWLQSHGFSELKVNPGRQTLEVTASAAQFSETFHTQIHTYSVQGKTHYANAGDPQIPAALAPVFGGFASLNNFSLRSDSNLLGKADYNPRTGRAKPHWTVSADYGESFVLSPGDFAVQYDLNPLYSAGTDGTGQTIAIVNESNILVSRVNDFRTLFGLPANPPQIIIDGNDPGLDGDNNPGSPNGASGEAYLDVEWSGAVAPKATIDLVIAADTPLSSGLLLAANRAVYGNVAPVMSLSFGYCEALLGSTNTYLDLLWEQAAAQGITVVVSTGDNGSADCDNPDKQDYADNGKAVSGFASTPYNVAVGGTDFYYSSFNQGATAVDDQLATYWDTTLSNSTPTVSIKGNIPEQPWNTSQYGLNILHSTSLATSIGAGSGGASSLGLATTNSSGTTYGPYPKPSWQSGPGVPADGARDLPDVSLFASNGPNATYYPVCLEDGDCQPVASGDTVQIYGIGGTSASAPAFAGIMALVNQQYGRQGQADFVLYPLAAQYPAAFHDVVNGTNTVPCASGSPDCIAVANPVTDTDGTVEGEIGTGSTPDYNATAGYDLATGLGTIDANVLVKNWNNIKLAASATTLLPSATTFAHGTPVTFSGSVTGSNTPSGSVALMTDNSDPLQSGQTVFELTNGAFSGSDSALPGGTYNIWGQYSGDGVNAASTSEKTQITVAPEASQLAFGIIDEVSQGSSVVTPGTQLPYGTQFVLTAEPSPSITSSSFGIPTGSVAFTDGATTLSTVKINGNGEASYNAPLIVGAHNLAASYAGDNSYTASTSTAIAFTVVKDTPLIGFSSPTQTGQTSFQGGGPIVFTIQVENGANNTNEQETNTYIYTPVAPPTGTVTITGLPAGVPASTALQSTLDLGTGAPEGAGTITASALPAGNYNLQINYPGDSNYNSVVTPLTISVSGSSLTPSTTTAASSAASTSPTAAVIITATVTGQTGKAAPTGSILVSTSGYQFPAVTLTSTGGDTSSAVVVTNSSQLLPGANVLTIQYTGDSVYQPSSTSLSVTNGVGPGVQSFALSATPISFSSPGMSGPSTVTVAPSDGFTGMVTLTCSVTNPPGSTNGPTCAAASAQVNGVLPVVTALTINTTASTPTATYTLNITGTSAGLSESTSIPVLVTSTANPGFTLAGTPISVSAPGGTGSSPITITPSGQFTGAVALSCSVSAATSGDTPTCTVSTPPAITGSASVAATLTVATTSATVDGTYTVTITGVSGAITQTTTVALTVSGVAPPAPGFSLSGVAITNDAPGVSATSNITVTPTGGYTGTVALTCAVTSSPSGAKYLPACTVTAPPAITGSTAVTATLTVESTAAATSALASQSRSIFVTGGSLTLASLFFFAVPRAWRKRKALLLLLLLTAVSGFFAGCGGSSSTSSGTGVTGTTPGAYVITVTGTSGTTTASTPVSVTIAN